jgi:hypothetical protein
MEKKLTPWEEHLKWLEEDWVPELIDVTLPTHQIEKSDIEKLEKLKSKKKLIFKRYEK